MKLLIAEIIYFRVVRRAVNKMEQTETVTWMKSKVPSHATEFLSQS